MSSTRIEQADDTLNHYRNEFLLSERNFQEDIPPDLKRIRGDAMDRFLTSGFPSSKDEEWRFTNIQPIARTKFTGFNNPFTGADIPVMLERAALKIPASRRFVFINGQYVPQYSHGIKDDDNFTIRNIRQAIAENSEVFRQHFGRTSGKSSSSLTALNTGLFTDGIFLHVPDNIIVTEPFYFLFITKSDGINFGTYPRNLVITGKNSKVSIIEHFVSCDKSTYFTNAVTELYMDAHAAVEHTKLQLESTNAFHINSLYAHQKTGSNLNQHSVMIGGALVRNEITAVLSEEKIECTLNGLSLAAGKQLIDNHTVIDHAKPRCESHELYKAILSGSSKGVFNGKIYVRKDAQKTDAKQTNKTLLLSDNATMNTKPQLEIFADDVKCTHGATIGYLDAEALFYLRSRGISENIARDLLTYAFANDVISKISSETIREFLNHLIYTRLKQGRDLENI